MDVDEVSEEQNSDVESVQKDPEEVAKMHPFSLKLGKVQRWIRDKTN